MKRIESVLGQIRAADEAQDNQWQEVVARELNEISKDCAMELQIETGQIRNKGDYQFGLDEWTYKNSIYDSRFVCMARLDDARETWVK
jgi:hypothetical protein